MAIRVSALTGGTSPSVSCVFGFAAAPDGMFYVFSNGAAINSIASEENSLYRFSPSVVTWTTLWSGPTGPPENAPWWTGSSPSVRYHMGLATTPNNMLYLFGGSLYGLGKGAAGEKDSGTLWHSTKECVSVRDDSLCCFILHIVYCNELKSA